MATLPSGRSTILLGPWRRPRPMPGRITTGTRTNIIRNVVQLDRRGLAISSIDPLGNTPKVNVRTVEIWKPKADPAGVRTVVRRNVFGEVISRTEDAGGKDITTQFTYDTNGNLLAVTDPIGRTTTWEDDFQQIGCCTSPCEWRLVTVSLQVAGRRVLLDSTLGSSPRHSLRRYRMKHSAAPYTGAAAKGITREGGPRALHATRSRSPRPQSRPPPSCAPSGIWSPPPWLPARSCHRRQAADWHRAD